MPFKTFGPRTKWWIKWIRVVQLVLRVFEMIAAAGILFLFIAIDNVTSLTAWVVRITVSLISYMKCSYFNYSTQVYTY